MSPVPGIFRILPEVILTLTGVAVMLIDASLAPGFPRRPLGWVAAIGTTLALWASLWQLSLPQGTGFSSTVETSAFTIFFHVLICGIVLVALLLSLDTLPEDSHHQGEYYALVVFGAVGMCLLTGAVELLLVFIALEISSISTYVLAGYRKQTGRGQAIKPAVHSVDLRLPHKPARNFKKWPRLPATYHFHQYVQLLVAAVAAQLQL